MIDPILIELRDEIKERNGFDNGFYGAFQLKDGKAVFFDHGDGEYVGLSDRFGNYFYLRYRDNAEFSKPDDDQKLTSCDNKEISVGVRLVTWYKDGIMSTLFNAIARDLTDIDLSGLDYNNAKVVIEESIFHPERIYEEETGQDKIKAVKNITLLAIDFRVQFITIKEPEACINRNFCQPC